MWQKISEATFSNEGEVETKLVLPLLATLGYNPEDIAPKFSVIFQTGKKGRPHECDFAVFDGPSRDVDMALIVVEAKNPAEALGDARTQAESYAQNLHAAVFVLTNGKNIEIWQTQISGTSDRIFNGVVTDILSSQAAIEALLLKPTLSAYKASLRRKNLAEATELFKSYEVALAERQAARRPFVERRLAIRGGGEIMSSHLVEAFPQGCIITGPSGYGKTALTGDLVARALSRRKEHPDGGLPVEVFIPDFVSGRPSLLTFVEKRIASQSPGVTESIIKRTARLGQIVLVLDGFDRIGRDDQVFLEAEVRLFLRDYPKCPIFLLTSPAVTPDVGIKTFVELGVLNQNDQQAIIRANAIRYGVSGYSRHMTSVMTTVCETPIALSLAIDVWVKTGRFPNDLASLFELWVSELLHGPAAPTDRLVEEQILQSVALATVKRPISLNEMKTLVSRRKQDWSLVERLLGRGAIIRRGDQFELQHEAIAEYFRARSMLSLKEPFLRFRLCLLSPSPHSLMPALLLSLAKTDQLQERVWRRVVRLGIPEACQAIRYRARSLVSSNLVGRADPSAMMLSDVLSGLVYPLKVHFSSVERSIYRLIAGETVPAIKLVGSLSEEADWLTYAAVAKLRRDGESIRIEKPSRETSYRRRYGHNLKRAGLTHDSGRLLGLAQLKDSLLELVESRQLAGGDVWLEERTLGRIRYLRARRSVSWNWGDGLFALRGQLQKKRNHIFRGVLREEQTFTATELIQDLDRLILTGRQKLAPWWVPLAAIDIDTDQGRRQLAGMLDEYHRRLQIAFSEVSSALFERRTLKSMDDFPAKYHLKVFPLKHQGYIDYWANWTVYPVSTLQKSGATVTFPDEAIQLDEDRYYHEVRRAYSQARGARANAAGPKVMWGQMAINDLDSSHQVNGLPHETAITAEVYSLIKNQIVQMFKDLPSTDI